MDLSIRREAASQAHRLVQTQPLYLDTETTGIGPTAEIIEIGIVDQEGAPLVDTLVKPLGRIESAAMRVHGITQEQVQNAPAWAEVWPQVEAVLNSRRVGVYNSEFDLRMLKQSHQRSWINWTLSEANFFCIMKLYARFNGEWDRRHGNYRYYSLEAAGRWAHIPLPNSHRAVDDARLARALLIYMSEWKG